MTRRLLVRCIFRLLGIRDLRQGHMMAEKTLDELDRETFIREELERQERRARTHAAFRGALANAHATGDAAAILATDTALPAPSDVAPAIVPVSDQSAAALPAPAVAKGFRSAE